MVATPLWIAADPLVLASRSATRITMLARAGIPVQAVPADLDERALEDDARASGQGGSIALHLAGAKALTVSRRYPGRVVLGADQTLLCDGLALHKPADLEDAARQLSTLSGRGHVLESAAVLACDGVVLDRSADQAHVRMRRLSEDTIRRYLGAAGPLVLGSVGGYHVEGLGPHLFEAIDGDLFTVMGLPLLAVLGALRRIGAVIA